MHRGLPWAGDMSVRSAPKGFRAPPYTRISSSYSSMTSSYSCSSMSTNSTNPVHAGHGEGIPGTLLLRWRSHCTSEANGSRRGNNPARMRHKSKEHCPGRALTSPGMADRRGKKFSPFPHRRKEARRDDSNRKLTTLAIWAHGELERDGLHTTNLRGDDVQLNGVGGDGESLN